MLHEDIPVNLRGPFLRTVATANNMAPDMYGAEQGKPIIFPGPAAHIADWQESDDSSQDQKQCQVGKST